MAADVEPKAPSRRRTHKAGEAPPRDNDSRHVESATERRSAPEAGTRDDPDTRERSVPVREAGAAGEAGPQIDPGTAAQHAARFVARLSGRRPESVISIERKDEEWRVGVEVVEVSRIPDTADILAVYEVRLDADGDLISYRRMRRYARGQLDSERQR
jgi:Gas vesicle synthesis protein GvpO